MKSNDERFGVSMKHLMTVSVGPVQEFIASARRSRDLWFGSWLLSELSKTAAKKIVESQGGDLDCLIFPKVSSMNDLENSEFNVVNKIVALVAVEKPGELGEMIYEAMQKRLDDIRRDAYQNVKGFFPKELQNKAEAQVKDLIEFFWTAVRIENPDDEDEYQKAREKVEYLFAARKATRNFSSTKAWSGNVPKSSLDGQRESVIPEHIYDDVRNGRMTKEQLRLQFGVREGERLCGVGLLKRHGNRKGDNSFFSTSHVASLPLLERMNRKDESEKVTRYIDTIKNCKGLSEQSKESEFYKLFGCVPKELEHEIFRRYDGHLLFAERLREFFDDQEKLNAANAALRKFLDDVIGKGKEPLPYYALLLADGDNMGKAIDKQAEKGKAAHQELSARLSEFAKEVKDIIEGEKQGSLIYAGGDDVLAFVGLHKVLEYADKLHKRFDEKLKEFDFEVDGEKRTPSLSVGIAVAHHLEPLEDALNLARKAEQAAKAIEGKNALAVIVDKRSGVSRTLKGRWGTVDQRLNQFVEWHRREEIPDGAAYQLRDLANRLEVSEGMVDKPTLDKIKLVEAKRILQRKRASRGEKGIGKEKLDAFGSYLKELSVEELADELIIAKIFAEAKQLSQPKQDKKDE